MVGGKQEVGNVVDEGRLVDGGDFYGGIIRRGVDVGRYTDVDNLGGIGRVVRLNEDSRGRALHDGGERSVGSTLGGFVEHKQSVVGGVGDGGGRLVPRRETDARYGDGGKRRGDGDDGDVGEALVGGDCGRCNAGWGRGAWGGGEGSGLGGGYGEPSARVVDFGADNIIHVGVLTVVGKLGILMSLVVDAPFYFVDDFGDSHN